MINNNLVLTLYLIFFALCSICYPASPDDSTNIIKANEITCNSQQEEPKICIAPVIAFGFVGATVGGAIGGSIDPPEKGPGGEMYINVSKTGAIGCAIGAIVGSYIGYRLARRDIKQLKEQAAKKPIQKE